MLFGRILFDSQHFSLEAGLLGGLSATSKDYGRTVRALRSERIFFLNVCSELERLGVAVAPGSPVFAEVCDDFCEAILSRPGARWQAYFRATAAEVAAWATPSQ